MTARMIRTALSLALVALIATTVAFAHQGGPGHRNPIDHMAQALDLTAEQKTQLQTIFQAQHDKMRARHQAMEAKLRSILTPEQLKQLDQLEAERREHRQQGGHNADHHGPPQAAPDGKHRGGHFAKLDLTEEQKAQMKAWFEAERPQMQAEHKAFMTRVEQILTPEQRAKLQQKMQERQDNNPGHGSGGQHGQPGPAPQQAPPQEPANDGDSNF